ncbi:hypothetical protein HK100_005072 [Physocladia obscura]|uniref:Uncharacterized protein n=1 Tax=Physocladia obscura TaxID=109957 RepID=A0AAD5SS53_9FUNG|nr:hypothetical protein HK100_005072 [Physocladia obscura]
MDECMAIYRERNINHDRHFIQLCAPPKSVTEQFNNRPNPSTTPRQIEKFRVELNAIPSLTHETSLISRICKFFSLVDDNVEEEEAEEMYYFSCLLQELEFKCATVEDRCQLWVALHKAFEFRAENMKRLLEKAEAAFFFSEKNEK